MRLFSYLNRFKKFKIVKQTQTVLANIFSLHSQGFNPTSTANPINSYLIIAGSIYLTMGGLLIYLTWMNTLNATTDETENSVRIEIRMDYLTEGETSPYVTLLHIYVAILLGTTTILGAEITAVLFLCHACGLFRVVW